MNIQTAEERFKTEFSILDQEYPELAANIRRKVIEHTKDYVTEALKGAAKIANQWENSGTLAPVILEEAYSLDLIK